MGPVDQPSPPVATWGSERGPLRVFLQTLCVGAVLNRREISEVSRGLLWCLGGDIPRGGTGFALAFCPCVFRLHSLKGAQGLLWRVAMSPRGVVCAFFHTHQVTSISHQALDSGSVR